MKIIINIAKNELRNLFYSPVAWFVAILFFIQCAIPYTTPISFIANWQDMLIKDNPNFQDFGNSQTTGIFLSPDGIFSNVLTNLYLFVPLLTMGLISREVNNNTINLLYSSPVKLRQIILGKYLAIMVYNLLLVLIVGIFVILGIFNIRSADYGLLLSALLGFYLLVCAFSAIGLFMSSLTNYQIVSAIATFTVIFVLGRIGTLWQEYNFVRDLTYFLSISGRTEKMIVGLISTKDVIYFLVVICMFLCFTLFKLKGQRETRPWTVKVCRYIMVIAAALLIGYVTSRPGLIGYWDTTARQDNTLHPRTQKILKELIKDSPVEVTLYTNLLGGGVGRGLSQGRNNYLSALWEPYLRFKPDIRFKYVYYYDNDGSLDSTLYKTFPNKTEQQIAAITADIMVADLSKFIGPKEIEKVINPNAENQRIFMKMKYQGRTVTLRTFDDDQFWPDEGLISAAIKRLVNAKAPKIYFLSGELERSIYKTGEREYSEHTSSKRRRFSLLNRGFDVDTLYLKDQEIPADITILVIADPKVTLSQNVLRKIQQYISSGGNLLIFGEPGKQQMLNPVLAQLGVQLMNGTLVELSKNETPDKVLNHMTDAAVDLSEDPDLLYLKENRKKKGYEDVASLLTAGVTALSTSARSPFIITPLLKTSPKKTWLKAGTLLLDSIPPIFSPQEGDVEQPVFSTSIKMVRQVNHKEQRIIVCGDADFMSNNRMIVSGNPLEIPVYSWLDYGDYPKYTPRPLPKDTSFNITGPEAKVVKFIFVWLIPGLLILSGTILLIRRKRK
jgi:ABC-2 type transport system permease protein